MSSKLLAIMTEAALAAGDLIMDVYAEPVTASQKSDGSPVTIADQKAEEIILSYLEKTGIPVLAEESAAAGHIPDLGNRFFVVDPLDGTKEFIKRNGEFTVNIALVENGRPVYGVVTAPALGFGFSAGPSGAHEFKIVHSEVTELSAIQARTDAPMRVVASRSHGHAALAPMCKTLNVVEDVSVGSSLKFCLVAKGDARFYPRFTPTCEWDTAAGQAVLEAVGGVVLTLDGKPLEYNKHSDRFYNPFFIAADEPELGRIAAMQMNKLIHIESDT